VANERVILDPAEVALPDRDELDLHAGPFQVREEGIDWGTAEIEAFMAQQQVGEAMIDYRLPNRTITIPLTLGASGSFDEARLLLQAKVSRINEEGGWLKREVPGGKHGFFDLVKATLKYGGSSWQAREGGFDPDVELVLEALPDFYGDVVTLGIHEGTGDLAWTEQIEGNLPGRVDLEIVDLSGWNQFALGWAFRCRNYSSAASGGWVFQAEALDLLGAAEEASIEGASGGKTVRYPSLGTDWTPILATLIGGVTYLTHVGVYDVWARVYTTSATLPWLRLVYDVGDLIAPAENEQVQIPQAGGFYLVNLGQVSIQPTGLGAHRWAAEIQGRGEEGGENVHVDRLWFLCADEGSGILKGSTITSSGTSQTGRDSFNQAAGALAGKIAEVGGTWSGAGDADDFVVVTE